MDDEAQEVELGLLRGMCVAVNSWAWEGLRGYYPHASEGLAGEPCHSAVFGRRPVEMRQACRSDVPFRLVWGGAHSIEGMRSAICALVYPEHGPDGKDTGVVIERATTGGTWLELYTGTKMSMSPMMSVNPAALSSRDRLPQLLQQLGAEEVRATGSWRMFHSPPRPALPFKDAVQVMVQHFRQNASAF